MVLCKEKVMKRRLILILIGALITLSCYSQNRNGDSDRNEYRDSVANSDFSEQDVREETDTTELAVPSREKDDPEVSPPSKGTGSPGLTGKGAYDVDGKINGKLDAKKKKAETQKTTPKSSTTGRDVE